MAKIYNEVVIDMNPESPTFEETLYEDAFEYSEGDMMLFQGSDPSTFSPEDAKEFASQHGAHVLVNGKYYFRSSSTGGIYKDVGDKSGNSLYVDVSDAFVSFQKRDSITDYGLESLKKSDFFEADGTTPKPMSEILALIKPHKPDVSDADILAQIEDMMPKLQEVSAEEKGFAREGFQKDVYGISKDAGKVGAQMRSAYGSGMGSSMRGAIAGQKDVTQQFKQAEQGYAQDIYGLEQKQEEEFEGDVSTWLQGFKQGGRVPSKQTFLEVLSKIPDAGGN